MIAYDHYIKFVPELENAEKVEASYSNVITVNENSCFDLDEFLNYELTFFNNQGRDLVLYTDRDFTYTQEGQFWAFEVKDVMTFFWYSGTLTLEYIKHENFTEALLKYWSLHIVLPMFFTIEETFYFLHAGAVEIHNEPVLFVAESFGGKSTMTDFFMKKGHTMISDDKVATYEKNGLFFAIASHPYHRPYRKMEDLGVSVEDFASVPKIIGRVYQLKKENPSAAIDIIELMGIEKFKSLRYASEMNLYFQKQKRFEYLMKMANTIQVFQVSVPWCIERLDEVYQAVILHHQNIKRDKSE